jgi:Tol biopolymer transport system component
VPQVSIEVPRGAAPTIDGWLREGEWDGARLEALAGGGELYLMYAEGFLYVGCRSEETLIGSLCLYRDGLVSILHSSAGLAHAAYVQGEDDWQQVMDFDGTLCCWDSEHASALDQHLQTWGWMASTMGRGSPREMEYRILVEAEPAAITVKTPGAGTTVALAATYLTGPGFDSFVYWPKDLNDDCGRLELRSWLEIEHLRFSPETWIGIMPGALAPLTGSGGGVIAFMSERDGNKEIYVMNGDGTDQRNLTNHFWVDTKPNWSPDGRKIAFTSDRDGNSEIYTMNSDGSDLRRLTVDPTVDSQATWSPDGTRIAFVSSRRGNAEVYVMEADGSGEKRLTVNRRNDWEIDWSPDGTQIAVAADSGEYANIYLLEVDGDGGHQLTDTQAHDIFPKWSPDGSRIAFMSQRDGNWEIYVMGADGSNQTRLTFDDAIDGEPSWSPDGKRLVFDSDRDGDFEIYVMDVPDGAVLGTAGLRQLTDNDADDRRADWGPVP